MSFLRQFIFGGKDSRPTSSVHSQTHVISKSDLQLVTTLHDLDLFKNETITKLVTEIVDVTNKHNYELKPCETYFDLIKQGIDLNETGSKTDSVLDMKVAIKVEQLEKIENAFTLVKKILTESFVLNENDKSKKENAQEYEQNLRWNRALKSEIFQLRTDIAQMYKSAKNAEENFIKNLNQVLNAEINRIQGEFLSLNKQTLRFSQKNENLELKIKNQEQLVNYITKKREDEEKNVLNEIQQIEAEIIDFESRLIVAEKENEEVSSKLQDLKDSLDEQEKLGDINGKNYNDKLGAFLKNNEEFKQGIEQRNEARCQRLKEENEKLRHENYDFSCKLLEMGVRQIFHEKPETRNGSN